MGPALLIYGINFVPMVFPNSFIKYFEAKEVAGKPAMDRLADSTASQADTDLKSGLYYLEIDQENGVLMEEEMANQKFGKNEVKGMIYFISDTLEPIRLGVVGGLNTWTVIGMPKYWNLWKTPEDVELDKVRHCWPYICSLQRLVGTSSSLDTDKVKEFLTQEEIKELKETFILSEKAKKFTVASVLLEGRDTATVTSQLHVFSILATMIKTVSVAFNDKFDMFKRHMLVRFSLYAVTSSSLTLGTLSILSTIESRLVKCQAEQMKSFGKEYVEGAIEYFEKQIRRAELMRKAKNEIYDDKGDIWRILGRSPESSAKEQLSTYKELL